MHPGIERRKSALTPDNYARAIISLSRRYSSTSAFPGTNYVDIGGWLLQDRSILDPVKSGEETNLFVSRSEQSHDLIVVYNSSNKKWNMQRYDQEQHQDFYTSSPVPVGGSGQLVFIRGFISPSWLSVLGSKFNVDPEFFRRHMDFLSADIHRHAYGFPSLASTSDNIFRLCVSTILHRDDFGGQDSDLQSQRARQATQLGIYKTQQLGSARVCCGDSLVREYSTICSRFSVIEQWISLYVTKTDRGWTVIAWMDQGRPLDKSPSGPWTHHIRAKATALPVLQHHHKMAFRNTTNRLDLGADASTEVPQSTAVLPLQYESVLSLVDLGRQAHQDPLSICIPLFAHAAFSEVQFLNLMDSKIQNQTAAMTEGFPNDTLENFQYFSSILNRHSRQLKDSYRSLFKLVELAGQEGPELDGVNLEGRISNKTPPGFGMPKGQQSAGFETRRHTGRGSACSTFTAQGLLEDYEELHIRCNELLAMCAQGITSGMGKASIEESRKAIEQSKRLKKLTILATLFIPLSFSTSLFGMNIDLLGQSTVAFWWFFVFCIPITLFAYMFYLWDFPVLRLRLAHTWKRVYVCWRNMTRVSDEKDATRNV